MKKKIVSIVTCLMMCTVLLLSGFDSYAYSGVGSDGLDFYVPYAEPSGDGVGYISILCEDSSGNKYLTTFYASIQPYKVLLEENPVDFGGFLNVNFDGNQVLVEVTNGADNNMYVHSLGFYTSSFSNMLLSSGLLGAEEWASYTLNYDNFGQRIIGYVYGGNCVVGSSPITQGVVPRIYWGGDNSVQLLDQITSLLGQGLVSMKLYLPKLSSIDLTLTEIKGLLNEMQGSITDEEQQKINKFEDDSGSQSNELDSLNQQTQVDKVDVDSASQTVDANLNIQTDANYGLLLSAFTSNQRILTMLILVASVSLISYVLFGRGD